MRNHISSALRALLSPAQLGWHMNPAPLTGLAIGDALGMPFETAASSTPTLLAWKGGYEASKFHKLQPGQFTDDTQMSLALAASLLEKRFYDPEHASKKYLAWFQSGDARGMGGSTRKALARLATGTPWYQAGENGAEGNGTAMRAAPIGMFQNRGSSRAPRGTERLRAAAHWARVDAAITHQSDEAKEGSAAIAVAVSHLCSGRTLISLLDTVLAYLEKSRVYFALEDLQKTMSRFAECHRDHCEILGEFLTNRSQLQDGPSARVSESVPAAFAALLSGSSYRDTVERAIRAGGDTDSVAAMAGAMAGALYGIEGIPDELIAGLEGAHYIREIELKLLG